MKLYLVRHGDTVGTVRKKYHGHTDVCLDKKGIVQVKRLARHLKKISFTAAYASDLLRCRQTAQLIIGRRRIPIEFKKGLREINFGRWEGKSFNEMQEDDCRLFEKWYHDLANFTMPDGESTKAMADRIIKEVNKIVRKHRDGNVLIVAHGGPIRVVLCDVLGLSAQSFWHMSIDAASLSIVDCENGFRSVKMINMVV